MAAINTHTENTTSSEKESSSSINKNSKVFYSPNPATHKLIVMVNVESKAKSRSLACA